MYIVENAFINSKSQKNGQNCDKETKHASKSDQNISDTLYTQLYRMDNSDVVDARESRA